MFYFIHSKELFWDNIHKLLQLSKDVQSANKTEEPLVSGLSLLEGPSWKIVRRLFYHLDYFMIYEPEGCRQNDTDQMLEWNGTLRAWESSIYDR